MYSASWGSSFGSMKYFGSGRVHEDSVAYRRYRHADGRYFGMCKMDSTRSAGVQKL
jgi:hypothetical protein